MEQAKPIRPAATVIVTVPSSSPSKPGIPDYEIFMVKRSHGSGFMAGAHVFPGGIVDDHDKVGWLPEGLGEVSEAHLEHSFRIAAIRELFEETGILVVDPTSAREKLDAPEIESWRSRVHEDASAFSLLCEELNCAPATDLLIPWARWITPPQEKRRYDARFYIINLETQPYAIHDDQETISSTWLNPADALEAAESGEIFLPPPTWLTFRELVNLKSQKELISAASKKSPWEPICPHLRFEEDQFVLLLPGDEENPDVQGKPGMVHRILLKNGRYQYIAPQEQPSRS